MVSIAAQLNERGIRTQRGGSWHVSSVANVLARANECDESFARRAAFSFYRWEIGHDCRATERSREIPIIFITAYPDEVTRAHAMKAGAIVLFKQAVQCRAPGRLSRQNFEGLPINRGK